MNPLFTRFLKRAAATAAALGSTLCLHAEDGDWWNKDWTQRQKITLDGSTLPEAAGESTLLLRVADGSIFANAREDGGDLRFIAGDGKTVLPHHIERYDPLLGEAFLWVKVPEVKPGAVTLHLYFGHPNAPAPGDPTAAYGADLSAVYHFAETGTPPADSTANRNNGAAAAATSEVALIGSGLRLLGNAAVTLNSNNNLAWPADGPFSVSLWLKIPAAQPEAVLLTRSGEDASFRLLLDQGVPVVETRSGDAPARSAEGAPLAPNAWNHLAVVAEGGEIRLFVNGEPHSTLAAGAPALDGPILLGAPEGGVIGEIDELRIHNTALTPAAIQLAFINQGGSDEAQRLLAAGASEGGAAVSHNETLEHIMLFGDIARNMMFDGWIAVGVCVLMIIAGWTVALQKFSYLNKIEKGNREFLKLWKSLSTDLTALDHADEKTIKSMGGSVDEEDQELMKDSPLYHIYHIGSDEIRLRLDKMSARMEGLPGRSIQAIRASLDAGLIHENHRLTNGLVYLTISVAGGPYVGLLGTVVGVMITFALIAKSGEVNVNSIAPGIASALLATVAGLVVAIPALFIYSYLNGRIKNVMSTMQVFIDEFVAKMAEFYRPQTEPGNDSEEPAE